MTAIVALQPVAEGCWGLGDPIGKFLPDLPDTPRGVTIDALLSHTSGVPNYHDLINWKHYDGMDNSKVVALLDTRRALDFPSGSRYGYSNSGYVLIASAIERLTGRPYHDDFEVPCWIRSACARRASMTARAAACQPRVGLPAEDGRLVLSDYHAVTIGGSEFAMRSSTVGAGGIYATIDDLYALDRALYTDRLLPLAFGLMAMAPRTPVTTELQVPSVVGHGYGWFLSRSSGRNLVWSSGNFAGHRTAILRVPDRKAVVIVLSSSAEKDAAAIARTIADRVVAKKDETPTPKMFGWWNASNDGDRDSQPAVFSETRL